VRVSDRGLPERDWHAYLRQRDLIQISNSFPGVIMGRIIEIGSGSGVVSDQLNQLADEVVLTDVNPRVENLGIIRCEVGALPFRDSEFQCVYSSNVLEHVDDLPAAMAEMKRVLSADGAMIHSMPTVSWKLLQLLTHPFGSVKAIWSNRYGRTASAIESSDQQQTAHQDRSPRNIATRIKDVIIAPVHGVGGSHFDELRRFSKHRWVMEFEKAGLMVVKTEGLFFHSPYRLFPYRFKLVREFLSRIGLATVRSYLVVSTDVHTQQVDAELG
jgi:SAM-dependent methyltransferase